MMKTKKTANPFNSHFEIPLSFLLRAWFALLLYAAIPGMPYPEMRPWAIFLGVFLLGAWAVMLQTEILEVCRRAHFYFPLVHRSFYDDLEGKSFPESEVSAPHRLSKE